MPEQLPQQPLNPEDHIPDTVRLNETAPQAEAYPIQFRSEHSRSVEDAEQYQAIATLKELGILLPLPKVDTWHGRVASVDEPKPWKVDPEFRNGSNDSENRNVNSRPTLYTSSKDIAMEFAQARVPKAINARLRSQLREGIAGQDPAAWRDRWSEEGQVMYEDLEPDQKRVLNKPEKTVNLRSEWTNRELGRAVMEAMENVRSLPEDKQAEIRRKAAEGLKLAVHAIVSYDTDASIFNEKLNISRFNPDQVRTYRKAMEKLMPSLTAGSPVDFRDSEHAPMIVREMNRVRAANKDQGSGRPYLRERDIEAISQRTGAPDDVVRQLAAAGNARQLLLQEPMKAAFTMLDASDNLTQVSTHDGKHITVSAEYIATFMRQAHVVGVKHGVRSATINKSIDIVSMFDLEKVGTAGNYLSDKERLGQRYGSLLSAAQTAFEAPKSTLLRRLTDVHASPAAIIEAASEIPGFRTQFSSDVGNWEGYTLAEHTETVLRNFDQNFADKFPADLLPVIRLAIVSHDIGKPIAAARNDKRNVKKYNLKMADVLFDGAGVDDKTAEFIKSVIGDGADLAAESAVHGRNSRLPILRVHAGKALQAMTGGKVTQEMIDGYLEICETLVTCDGGAYTTMALTRGEDNVHYRNAGSFDDSFKEPVTLTKKTLRLKNGGIAERSRKPLK